jgi:hypothetical protein
MLAIMQKQFSISETKNRLPTIIHYVEKVPGSSFSMWLSVKAGCQSGKALKSRILAHTSSMGALITELLKILAIASLLPCYLKGL